MIRNNALCAPLLAFALCAAVPAGANDCSTEFQRVIQATGVSSGPRINWSRILVHPDATRLSLTCATEHISEVRGLHEGPGRADPFLRVLARVGAVALSVPEPALHKALTRCRTGAGTVAIRLAEGGVDTAALECSVTPASLAITIRSLH